MLLLEFFYIKYLYWKIFLILAASVSPLALLSLVLVDRISHQSEKAALPAVWVGELFSSCI